MTVVRSAKSSVLKDVKELFKAGVLAANVLPVFTGFWLALYSLDASFSDHWLLFVLTISGSTLVMAGALVLNNWYEVDIDRMMARTQVRPTVTGNISLRTVLVTGIALSVAGFVLLSLTTLAATIYAFIGWFTYVVLYTMWSKRRFSQNTIIGSVSGAVTPFIGWAALDSALHVVPIMLFLLLFIWQMPHTYAIAIRKYDEYKAAGVAMLPVVHGLTTTKRRIVIYVACLIPIPFFLAEFGTLFVTLATIVAVAWLAFSVYGFVTTNNERWARISFLFSVNYLFVIFVMLVIVTSPLFQ